MAAQLQFPVRAARFCVLFQTSGVREVLPDFDLDADAVIAACRDHTLAPAFDIGLGSRELIRILPSAVPFYAACGGARTRRLPLVEIFQEVLRGYGAGTDRLTGEQARKILNCEGGHINALVDDGELSAVPGTVRRLGPGGSDVITLASFKDFLKRRLL